MGNCQAAEAAAAVIQHSSGKVETVYWSLSANQVMAANPGHYVAIVITSTSTSDSSNSHGRGNKAPVKQLKLLRPDDTLHIGHVYRLVSFEEVLKELASKRHAKLSRLFYKQKDNKPGSRKASSGREGERRQGGRSCPATESEISPAMQPQEVEPPARAEVEFEELVQRLASNRRTSTGAAGRQGQWRPALQSIAEIGS